MYPVDVEYRPPRAGDVEDGEADYVEWPSRPWMISKGKSRPATSSSSCRPSRTSSRPARFSKAGAIAGVTVLPLYARLPGGQQGRVYSVTGPEDRRRDERRRDLADDSRDQVRRSTPGWPASPSICPAPGINSLPIRPVSQSSADQRKGRCGRVQAGVCVRLYSEEDYASEAAIHAARDPPLEPGRGHPPDDRPQARPSR